MLSNLLTQFGASSSGLGALGIDFEAFLIQLGTFVIAFLVLRQFAFKPIMQVMNRRRETIEKGVSLGEQMQKQQAEMDKKTSQALQQARTQADEIIASAETRARQNAKAAEEKARNKADSIVASAEDRIKQDTNRARQKLEKQLAGLVAEVTEVIVEDKIDASKDRDMINKVLKQRSAS